MCPVRSVTYVSGRSLLNSQNPNDDDGGDHGQSADRPARQIGRTVRIGPVDHGVMPVVHPQPPVGLPPVDKSRTESLGSHYFSPAPKGRRAPVLASPDRSKRPPEERAGSAIRDGSEEPGHEDASHGRHTA